VDAGGHLIASERHIGDMMADGTVYAGISPSTGDAMYSAPDDAPVTMTFNEAQQYAAKLNAYGHGDWRVPTADELNVLFKNRAAIGGFDVSGSDLNGWYWSSSTYDEFYALGQRFRDGSQYICGRLSHSSVRLVRTEIPRSNLTKGAKP
jgi:hypothetical protein